MTTYRFLEPLDVLFLRGNRAFGDPGSFGETLMPPWPSVAAGALRSQILARDGSDLAAFAAGRLPHPQLGTPQRPGAFAVTSFLLARRAENAAVEGLFAPPADLVFSRGEDDALRVQRLSPQPLAAGVLASASLSKLPVLAELVRRKPASGLWLTQTGWARYLAGATPTPDDLIERDRLWALDPRIGVGLDPERHRADDGKLFSPQALAPCPGLGFLVGIDGAEPPSGGTLRLGGDGRGAGVAAVPFQPPRPDLDAIACAHRCRLVLTSPGIFSEGWRLPGADRDGAWGLNGVSGRLVCAAVPRGEVVSGWDLARWQPKPAQRAAPTGSVYWIEDLDATPDILGKLAATGLWPEGSEDAQRRAEGFNRFTFAAY